jgi:hypothetical protein
MSNHLRVYAELRGHGARGPRYRVRMNTAASMVLVESTTEPLLDAARILIAKGITGKLQLWDSERPYFRLQGDIAWLATKTVMEGRDQSPAYRRYVERAQDGEEQAEPSSARATSNGRPCIAAQGSDVQPMQPLPMEAA